MIGLKMSDEQYISKARFQQFVTDYIVDNPYLTEDAKKRAMEDADMEALPQGFYMTFFVEMRMGVNPEYRQKYFDDFKHHVISFGKNRNDVIDIQYTDWKPAEGWDDGLW